jgi:hypothetical protein
MYYFFWHVFSIPSGIHSEVADNNVMTIELELDSFSVKVAFIQP